MTPPEESTQTRHAQLGKETYAQEEVALAPKTKPQAGKAGGRLRGKVALVTGADRGLGRAVAVALAREGADLAIVCLHEHTDAAETARLVESEGQRCLLCPADPGQEELCEQVVQQVADEFGRIDILVNIACMSHPQKSIRSISDRQLERTFRSNIFAAFYMVKAALPHMKDGSCIINTASVWAYRGCPTLLDYSAAAGAVVAFTRSLSLNLASRNIRVNTVAPGCIDVAGEGKADDPASDAGLLREIEQVAQCYVFLACNDSAGMTGQTLHPNGEIVNG